MLLHFENKYGREKKHGKTIINRYVKYITTCRFLRNQYSFGRPENCPRGKLPPSQGQGQVQDQHQNQGWGAIFLGAIFLALSLVMLLIKKEISGSNSQSILYEYNVLKFDFFDLNSQENGKFILNLGQLNNCVIWFVQFQK